MELTSFCVFLILLQSSLTITKINCSPTPPPNNPTEKITTNTTVTQNITTTQSTPVTKSNVTAQNTTGAQSNATTSSTTVTQSNVTAQNTTGAQSNATTPSTTGAPITQITKHDASKPTTAGVTDKPNSTTKTKTEEPSTTSRTRIEPMLSEDVSGSSYQAKGNLLISIVTSVVAIYISQIH